MGAHFFEDPYVPISTVAAQDDIITSAQDDRQAQNGISDDMLILTL